MHLAARDFFREDDARMRHFDEARHRIVRQRVSTYAGGYQDPVFDSRHDSERRVRPQNIVALAKKFYADVGSSRFASIRMSILAAESLAATACRPTDAIVNPETGLMQITAPGVHIQRTENTFEARLAGRAIAEYMPNVTFSIPPMITFNLHDMAENPEWVLKVRHVCYNSRWPSHPKISLVTGREKNCFIKLRVPQRPLYWDISEVAADLAAQKFQVSNSNYVLSAPEPVTTVRDDAQLAQAIMRYLGVEDPEDLETALVRHFNAERYARQSQWPVNDVPPIDKANVVDLVARIAARAARPHDPAIDEFLRTASS